MRKMKIIIETNWYERYEITEIRYDNCDYTIVTYKNCDDGKIDYYDFDGCLSLDTIVLKLKEILNRR